MHQGNLLLILSCLLAIPACQERQTPNHTPSRYEGLIPLEAAHGIFWGQTPAAWTGLTTLASHDLNGDGRVDPVVGAPLKDGDGHRRGGITLLFTPLTPALEDGQFHQIEGQEDEGWLGYAMGSGDFNHDGQGDLMLGEPGSSLGGEKSGALWLWPGPVQSTSPGAAHIIAGAPFDEVNLSTLCDLNGDGLMDLILGAPKSDRAGQNAGAAFIFYGPLDERHSVAEADITLLGEAPGDHFGHALDCGPNPNGSPLPALAISAPQKNPGGMVYLFTTPPPAENALLAAERLKSQVPGASAGETLKFSPDIDGDRRADLIIGAHFHGQSAPRAGALFIVSGKRATNTLEDLPTAIYGDDPDGHLGASLMPLGDIDGDGWPDLLIGAYGNNGMNLDSGQALLFYGPLLGQYSANEADAFFLGQNTGDHAGIHVSGGGDIDGDGWGDFIIGASHAQGDGAQPGAAYLFLSGLNP